METGFRDWSKQDFNNFIAGNEKFGRKKLDLIAQLVGKTEPEVQRYAVIFWARID